MVHTHQYTHARHWRHVGSYKRCLARALHSKTHLRAVKDEEGSNHWNDVSGGGDSRGPRGVEQWDVVAEDDGNGRRDNSGANGDNNACGASRVVSLSYIQSSQYPLASAAWIEV